MAPPASNLPPLCRNGARGMITLDRELAIAASLDAGNRSMRRRGAAQWDENDYNAASEAYAELEKVWLDKKEEPGMKITIRQLKKLKACQSQLDLFISSGLDGVEITVELCIKHAQDFDWNWAATRLLSRPAWAEYNRVTAPARAEYNRVAASARAEYNRVKNLALAEYQRVTALALADLKTAQAKAFFAATLTTSTA